jgi:hypothetical protein
MAHAPRAVLDDTVADPVARLILKRMKRCRLPALLGPAVVLVTLLDGGCGRAKVDFADSGDARSDSGVPDGDANTADVDMSDGRTLVAFVQSISYVFPGTDVDVYGDGSAHRMLTAGLAGPPLADASVESKDYAAGSPEVTMFLADLAVVGDVSTLPTQRCTSPASAGPTTLTAGGHTSGNISCPLLNPTPQQQALVHDSEVLLGFVN